MVEQGKGRRKYGTYNVPAQRFIEVWEESNSIDEVAEKLGMPVPIVNSRKSSYVGMGIQLKNMDRRKWKKLDIDKLNGVIAAIRLRNGLEPPAKDSRVKEVVEFDVDEKNTRMTIMKIVDAIHNRI